MDRGLDAFADLQLHSTASDGSDTPSEVVRRAHAMGFAAIALTDHDTLAGVAEARESARPCVIVAKVETHRYISGTGSFWDVGVPRTTQNPVAAELSGAHEADRSRQRFFSATTAPGA